MGEPGHPGGVPRWQRRHSRPKSNGGSARTRFALAGFKETRRILSNWSIATRKCAVLGPVFRSFQSTDVESPDQGGLSEPIGTRDASSACLQMSVRWLARGGLVVVGHELDSLVASLHRCYKETSDHRCSQRKLNDKPGAFGPTAERRRGRSASVGPTSYGREPRNDSRLGAGPCPRM